MADKENLQVNISGYIGEILCGQIPLPCKAAFTRHIIAERVVDEIPEWQLRRNPAYVSPGQIERLWYVDDEAMRHLMKPCGLAWNTHRDVNGFCHLIGFGSGREGIGLFDIAVVADGKPVLEFVPFEPGPESGDRLRNMNHIGLNRLAPAPLPSPDAGHVAVSAGSWGKGIIRFSIDTEDNFDENGLELLVSDLTQLGIGEEHFVSGITYGGRRLKGDIIKQGDRERYPVLWHDPQDGRWRHMYETGPFGPSL